MSGLMPHAYDLIAIVMMVALDFLTPVYEPSPAFGG
jgi:hypothetical protein